MHWNPLLENGWVAAASVVDDPWILAGLKGTLALAAAFLLTRLLRRSSAATRHLVWTSAFAMLLAIPVLSWALPAWSLQLPQPQLPSDVRAPIQHGTPSLESANKSMEPPPLSISVQSRPGASPDLGAILFWAWLAGLLALLGRGLLGAIALRRVVATAQRLDDPQWSALLSRLQNRLGMRGKPTLLLGEESQMPLTGGIRRPFILLPRAALQWSRQQRETVLLHELSHIHRHDMLLQRLAYLALLPHFLNPLAWMAWRRLRQEREMACDDLVLSTGATPSDYARVLLSLANQLSSSQLLARAPALSMANPGQLEGRLLAILDPVRPRRRFSLKALGACLGVAFLLAAPMAALSLSAQERASSGRSADLSFSHGESRFQIEMEGVRLSGSYELIGIAPGGSLYLQRKAGGEEEELRIEPGAEGGLVRSYRLNGREVEDPVRMESLFQEAMGRMREIDQGHERAREEISRARREIDQSRAELEGMRREMEGERERVAEEVSRVHAEMRAFRGAALSQQRQALDRAEEELRRTLEQSQQELRTQREGMLKARLELEATIRREQESLRQAHDQLRDMREEIQRHQEQARNELARIRIQLQKEMEKLGEIRDDVRKRIAARIVDGLDAIKLPLDDSARARLIVEVSELAARIVGDSSLRIEEGVVSLDGDPDRIGAQLRLFLEACLPGKISDLDQSLQDRIHLTLPTLAAELADWRGKIRLIRP